MVALLREKIGWLYYGAAVAYSVCGYAAAIAGLFSTSLWVNVLAVFILAHSMTIAAYLIHECAHNLIFSRSRHNASLGRVLSWLCGACYGTYEDIRYKHFRHHVDNDDVVWFAYDEFFERQPHLTNIIRRLEWAYIPAHDLLMHGVMVLTSFVIPERRKQRIGNVAVILIRGGVFLAVAVVNVKAALLYAVAYLLMVHILRFMDSVQHDYPYNTTLFSPSNSANKGDQQWEQEHTFSNTFSLRFPWLNLLTLNFGYHNAHHSNMNLPFYRLPQLHAELSKGDESYVIPLPAQVSLYHRNRVARIYNPQPLDYPQGAQYLRVAQSGAGPIGGNAASFLTSF